MKARFLTWQSPMICFVSRGTENNSTPSSPFLCIHAVVISVMMCKAWRRCARTVALPTPQDPWGRWFKQQYQSDADVLIHGLL